MELHILIRIPLLLIPFGFIIKYRTLLVSLITRIKLPAILLALISSIPLIIFEEHINCGAFGCTNVFLPPTLLFLLVLELLFFLILKVLPIKKVVSQTIFLSLLGFVFEFTVGSASTDLHSLLFANPLIFLFILLWVGVSYAFVLYIPLLVIKAKQTQNL